MKLLHAFFAAIAVAGVALPLSGQTLAEAVELRVAAINLVLPRASSPRLLLVPHTGENLYGLSEASRRVGATVGRRTCDGRFACDWLPGKDTIAVRIQILDLSDNAATVIVDSWGALSQRTKDSDKFMDSWHMSFRKISGHWRVVGSITHLEF